ncbi:MAG: hypothetical protein ACMUJM_24775 [bacterium]
MDTRREFLKKIIIAGSFMAFGSMTFAEQELPRKYTKTPFCNLYRAINGTPAMNLCRVIELMGGIERIIGVDDIVVIKPNLQWWNQGAPNLATLQAFVDLIMNRPGGFKGEVVIGENCHRGLTPWVSLQSGWAPRFERNSDLPNIANMNDLTADLKNRYGKRYSTCHWIDVMAGGKRVFSPVEGAGYVYCDGSGGVPLISFDNGKKGDGYRAVIMSYPIFKTDIGTIIDFRKGIWNKGSYTEQPFRFINFPALNPHSSYCGATSAVKNYLGISDMSGGPDPCNGGRLIGNYCNFHSFPFNKWSPGPVPGMLGAEIGVFMNTIRKADLNITTAEWTGLVSRTELPVAHTRAVLACKDPVVLDYHATKYLLYPNSKIPIHNPDNKNGSLYHYLKKCAEVTGFVFDEEHVAVKSYDFYSKKLQDESELVIRSDRQWGHDFKMLMKYFIMRYING